MPSKLIKFYLKMLNRNPSRVIHPQVKRNGMISAAEYKTHLFDTRLSSRVMEARGGTKNSGSRQNEKHK